MKYLLLEDEPPAARKLDEMIGQLRPDWQRLATVSSLKKLREGWTSWSAEVVFADIHLADGLSLQFFKERQPSLPIIFTTAYDRYALEAFKHHSIDYLLKPIGLEDLRQALTKLQKWQSQKIPEAINWLQLLEDYRPQYKKRFMVSHGERIKSIPASEVAYFYAKGKHCFLCTTEGREFLFDVALKELEAKLNPQEFFRINRQMIVHIQTIAEVQFLSRGRLKVLTKPATPEEALVSTDKTADFKRWLNH